MYDAIVVGARCAGSSTALLLARSGLNVLVLERARFPKDTFNGHAVLAAGARYLDSWGLLKPVVATGSPPFAKHRYDMGFVEFDGNLTWPDGSTAVEIAPRRNVLDTMLAEAAAKSGAEVRYGFVVDDLLWERDRVVGVRGLRGFEERAKIVIGADGMRSCVASAVGAWEYEKIPSQTCGYYSYWSDVATDALEIIIRPGNYGIVCPTNDGLTWIAIGWPVAEFPRVRGSVEANFLRVVDTVPGLAARMRGGRREEPFRGTADLPMYLRTPHGPGWALVGDAGCRVDPITGQGITDAFRDAELLSEAIVAGLSGAEPLHKALAGYQTRRDAAVLPMYRFTADRAALRAPTPQIQQLFSAMSSNQQAADQFAGITAGTTSIPEFFAPDNLARIVNTSAARAA